MGKITSSSPGIWNSAVFLISGVFREPMFAALRSLDFTFLILAVHKYYHNVVDIRCHLGDHPLIG